MVSLMTWRYKISIAQDMQLSHYQYITDMNTTIFKQINKPHK